MLPLSLASAGVVLVGTAVIGVVAHELSHALGLRMAGVPCRVEFLPGRGESGNFRTGLRGPLARVTPTRVPDDLPPWRLRVTAMMPLCLAVPVGFAFAGVVPDPFAVGDRAIELAVIAWLGCSVPSPRDFSILWYPERAIALHGDADATAG